MSRAWSIVFAGFTFLACILFVAPRPASAGYLSVGSSCADGSTIHVQWSWYEDPQNPTGHPEWTGYDLLRATPGSCAPFQRVNAEPFARIPGQSQSFEYTEPAPATGTTFQYHVLLVDANRQPIALEPWLCDLCPKDTWVSCPELSAPVTQGTLADWGWALYIQSCSGSCSPSLYFDDPATVAALRPYVGTGAVFRFYGNAACGSVEGCGLLVTRWDATICDTSLPARGTTWGRLRTTYR